MVIQLTLKGYHIHTYILYMYVRSLKSSCVWMYVTPLYLSKESPGLHILYSPFFYIARATLL